MRRLFLILFLLPVLAIAQKKQLTLDDVFKKNIFRDEAVRAQNVGKLATLFDPQDVKDETGKLLNTDVYEVSADNRSLLFTTDREAIYRRSAQYNAYLYDVASKKTVRLNKGKVLHPSFSPDGTKVAYVFENNLYLYDVASGKTTAITTDGKWNHIINGNADWVYEEEFSFSQAYEWSPNGKHLAYYKFDESRVKEFSFTLFDDQYNKEYRYKYPKAGDSNSTVSIHIYNVASSTTVPAQYTQGDIYIPRIKWTQSDNNLVVFWMNRLQNHLQLLLTDATTGQAATLYEEKNKYYVDINDDWWFLKDGKHMLYGSEKEGWYRLYLHSLDGKKTTALTKLNSDVTDIHGVDEKAGLVYYSVAYPTPMDRNLFVSDFSGKKTVQLTNGSGWHAVSLSPDFTSFVDRHSNINTPQRVVRYNIRNKGGKLSAEQVAVLSENNQHKELRAAYDLGKFEFLRVPNRNGDTINGFMLKPANFDPAKKYPVLFCNYGGPGSQEVANRVHRYHYWYQLMAQRGIIVVSFDNTGTGFRGEEFKKKTYLQLGKYEIEDQIDAAKWLRQQPFVDGKKIGHWGWSFGGFMSSLALTKGADVFTAAVAVAPVTSWRYYDNIYTERFLRTPQENPKGYDENSPINYVDKIRGKYLLVHGSADDNVHFQNSTQMVTALVKANVDFESVYYPNKNHGIRGTTDNTTYHLFTKMTNWILENLGNENVDKTKVGSSINSDKAAF